MDRTLYGASALSRALAAVLSVGGALFTMACSSETAALPHLAAKDNASSGAGGPSGFGGPPDAKESAPHENAGPSPTMEASSLDVADAFRESLTEAAVSDAAKLNRKVLFVGGEMPMVGVDLQIHELLKTRNIEVENAREIVNPARAEGKGLIIVSYSVASASFHAADFADVPVPLMLMEHFLLPDLGMTSAEGHGYQPDVTQISLTSRDAILTAGLPLGDVTIYSQIGEVFWGIPSPAAITVATVKGNPQRAVSFAYPAGAMMVGRVAKAKRMQIFVAVHAPPANPQPFLNATGLDLVGGGIDWCLQ